MQNQETDGVDTREKPGQSESRMILNQV